MSDRAISTVVDVTLCLLLVSAAVATLVLLGQPPPQRDPTVADHVAATLAAGTTSVAYQPPRSDVQHAASGPIAGLLADAALRNLSIDGAQSAPTPLERALDRRVDDAVRDHDLYAVAHWRPGPNASIAGRASIGTPPPPRVDTSSARLHVSSGLPANRSANRTARALVATLVDPRATDRALEGGGVHGDIGIARLASVADRLGLQIDTATIDTPVAPVVDRLVEEIAGHMGKSPAADTVTIEVTTY